MIIELLILLFTWVIVWALKINLEKKWRNFPPGPLQLPILGNIPQLASSMSPNKAPYIGFKDYSLKYGPISSCQFGTSQEIILDDPDLIKEVLSSEVWSDRYFDVIYGLRSFAKPYGILFSSGDEWKEMRRFTLRTLRDFGFGKKDQETVFQEELQELMSRLDSRIDKSDSGKSQNLILCMEQFFTISVLNVVWSLIAGDRFSHDDQRLRTMNEVASKLLRDNPIGGNLFHAYPSCLSRFIFTTLTKNGVAVKKYMGEMQDFFRGMLNERRALGFYKEDQRDFIEVFLKKIDDHKNKGKDSSEGNFYTDNQLLIVVLDLFLAGSETTSNTLEFAMLRMILNPNIQKKIQEEIDQVVGRSRFPSYALDRVKMPYTEATLHEVQRMSSVVPLDNRNSTEDTTLGGYFIPKGTSSVINIHSVHYNPKLWDDPHVFRPERFLNSQNNVVNTNLIIPFGGGKRLCLGEAMARATLFTFFTSFLQKYNLERVPNQPDPVSEPKSGFTLAPHAYDVQITYR